MKVYQLRKEQFVGRPLTEVFSFFERPGNLAAITPPSMEFRIVTPPPIVMKEGALFEYSVRVMGIRMRWKSLISQYTPPFRFVDEQVKGPYSFWHHTHTFTEVHGGTLIGDEVRYAIPFGMIGRITHRLAVSRQLEHIFSLRSQVMCTMFGSDGGLIRTTDTRSGQ
ncbi:MAG: SRPBCC family protein [Bacteroidota bacterium]